MERALEAIELFAHFCRATGIADVRPVATSAIRDAANRDAFLAEVRRRAGLYLDELGYDDFL
jgi:exopolyphosphatase/guanosine-5'-triphosphate,3'-diphosphate pyrophosphatase